MANSPIPVFNSPFLDQSGRITRPWWLYLQSLGITQSSTDESSFLMPDTSSLEAVQQELIQIKSELNTAPNGDFFAPNEDPAGRLEALEAIVEQLRSDIESIKQGTTP